jgi:hypothetical protein
MEHFVSRPLSNSVKSRVENVLVWFALQNVRAFVIILFWLVLLAFARHSLAATLHFGEKVTLDQVTVKVPEVQIKKAKVAEAKNEEPKPKAQTGYNTILASACAGDGKCICINSAIFKHDSSWATAGIGKKTNNVCNMRPPKLWKPSVPFTIYNAPGNGKFAKFNSIADGITACVELYQRNYKHLPPAALVSRWTDKGGNRAYRSSVASCYL